MCSVSINNYWLVEREGRSETAILFHAETVTSHVKNKIVFFYPPGEANGAARFGNL